MTSVRDNDMSVDDMLLYHESDADTQETLLRYGHLAHHRFNRHAFDCPDVLDGDKRLAVRIGYYVNLLGGVYGVEVFSTLASLLPRPVLILRIGRLAVGGEPSLVAVISGMQRAVADVRLSRARVDCVLALALYGTAALLYGVAWPLLLAVVVLRGMIISLFDSAPHYAADVARTGLQSAAADEESNNAHDATHLHHTEPRRRRPA